MKVLSPSATEMNVIDERRIDEFETPDSDPYEDEETKPYEVRDR